MKLVTPLILILVAALSGLAQSAVGPRIVVIDSDMFALEQTGIQQVNRAYEIALAPFIPSSVDPAERKAGFERRLKMLMDPINASIARELAGYLRDRGMVLLLDMSRYEGVLIWRDERIDITRDFIAYYNNRFPVKR